MVSPIKSVKCCNIVIVSITLAFYTVDGFQQEASLWENLVQLKTGLHVCLVIDDVPMVKCKRFNRYSELSMADARCMLVILNGVPRVIPYGSHFHDMAIIVDIITQ